MNIDQHEKKELATLCAAFGPTLIALGAMGVSGTTADIFICMGGALSTTYALLFGFIRKKSIKFIDKSHEKQHWM